MTELSATPLSVPYLVSLLTVTLTPEYLAFMEKYGGMQLPEIAVETPIGIVTLSIIARPA